MSLPNPVTTLLKSSLQQQFCLPSTSCPAKEQRIIIWKDRASIRTRHGRCQVNKNVNLKVEKNVVFKELLRTIAWETLSQMTLRNCSKKVVEETGYIRVFLKTKQKKIKCMVKHQKITSHHTKNQTLKLMIVVLLYIWEDAIVRAHWNHFFDMHVSYLGPVSSFFPFWIPLRAHYQRLQCWWPDGGAIFIAYWDGRQDFFVHRGILEWLD